MADPTRIDVVEDPNQDSLMKGLPRRGGLPFLDPVVLVETLGHGGMASVRLGYHCNLRSWVAVKLRRPSDERDAERFQNEAHTLAALKSSQLVRVNDVSSVGGLHYIVMEFVNGEDLHGRVHRRGPLALPEAIVLMLEAAEGVAEAHRRRIWHRDIKPANILVAASGEVKVADLGIAKAERADITGLTLERTVMGTPGYMAPELYRGARNACGASDVFALAATLAYLLVGRNVIAPANPDDLDEAMAKAKAFPDLATFGLRLSQPMRQFFAAATAADPQQRIADAAEFAAKLRQVAAADPALDLVAVNLADSGAERFSPAVLAGLRQRVLSAISDSVTPLPDDGDSRDRGTLPPTIIDRRPWRLIAGMGLGLAAAGVVVFLALNRQELSVSIGGRVLDGAAAYSAREGETLSLAAACTKADAQCRWELRSGPPEVAAQVSAGSLISLQLPALEAKTELKLVATADLGGVVLSREVTIVVDAANDKPAIERIEVLRDRVTSAAPAKLAVILSDDGDIDKVKVEWKSDNPSWRVVEAPRSGNRAEFTAAWDGDAPAADLPVSLRAQALDAAKNGSEEKVVVLVVEGGGPVAIAADADPKVPPQQLKAGDPQGLPGTIDSSGTKGSNVAGDGDITTGGGDSKPESPLGKVVVVVEPRGPDEVEVSSMDTKTIEISVEPAADLRVEVVARDPADAGLLNIEQKSSAKNGKGMVYTYQLRAARTKVDRLYTVEWIPEIEGHYRPVAKLTKVKVVGRDTLPQWRGEMEVQGVVKAGGELVVKATVYDIDGDPLDKVACEMLVNKDPVASARPSELGVVVFRWVVPKQQSGDLSVMIRIGAGGEGRIAESRVKVEPAAVGRGVFLVIDSGGAISTAADELDIRRYFGRGLQGIGFVEDEQAAAFKLVLSVTTLPTNPDRYAAFLELRRAVDNAKIGKTWSSDLVRPMSYPKSMADRDRVAQIGVWEVLLERVRGERGFPTGWPPLNQAIADAVEASLK